METTGVCQGMGIMHSDGTDTVYHSRDATTLSADVSAVLRSE